MLGGANRRYLMHMQISWELSRLQAAGAVTYYDLQYLERLLDMDRRQLLVALKVPSKVQVEDDDDDDELQWDMEWGPRRARPHMVVAQGLADVLPHALRLLRGQAEGLRQRRKPEVARNLGRFAKLLGLTQIETSVFLFLYAIATVPGMHRHVGQHTSGELRPLVRFMAAALDFDHRAVRDVMRGRFQELGLLDKSSSGVELSDEYLDLLDHPDPKLLGRGLFRRVPREQVPLESHTIDTAEVACLQALLERPPAASSTHVLLHGAPGTGKSSFARGLVQAMGVPAYEVLVPDDNRSRSRRLALMVCINTTGDGAVIIVDEADDMLGASTRMPWGSAGGFTLHSRVDKGWLNQLLDRPGTRMIWVTNGTEGIDPSVRRRFAHSVAFWPLGRAQRRQIWDRVLRRHGVKRLVNSKQISNLATRYDLSVGDITLAVQKAREAVGNSDRGKYLDTLRRMLDARSCLLSGNQVVTRDREQGSDLFTLDGLNVEGGLRPTLDRLEAFDQHQRSGRGGGPRQMNLLFTGPPGTGKSELARHVAQRLDRPLLVKRASDLLNPYVGRTEQHIAGAFQEAEDREAVLVIDEADSLLFDRDQAVRSWERSFTNEMLSGLERYRGVLVFTSNRVDDLDRAAIRRFNGKLRFGYLTGHGNEVFYRLLLASRCKAPVTKAVLAEVRQLRGLAPGDFKVVAEQFAFERPGAVSHADFVAGLEREVRLKGRGRDHRAGF